MIKWKFKIYKQIFNGKHKNQLKLFIGKTKKKDLQPWVNL